MSKKKTPVFTEDTTQRPSLLIASIPYDIILFKGFLNKTEQPKSLFKINILNPKNQIITFVLFGWAEITFYNSVCEHVNLYHISVRIASHRWNRGTA